uniref:Uncharacterized protein n=1 Tax=Romanomermis culicivorax TaxID=13658 RepID=A0A915K8Y2_ROMCU
MEAVYRYIKGKILPYLRDRMLLLYDQVIENHSLCSEILRFCLIAFILPFFIDYFFDSIFRVYVFPLFFLGFLAIYFWNSHKNIEEIANKSFRTVKFFGDDQNRATIDVGGNCDQIRLIILLFCIDVVSGISLIGCDPFLFIVSILCVFYYGRIKSRGNNLNLIIFLRLVSFRTFFESPVYLRLLLAYSPIFTAHLLYNGNYVKVNNRGSIIRRHLLTYESHHSNSSPISGESTPTRIIESLTFTSSNNVASSPNNDRASSFKKRANSYSNTASTINDEESEDLLLAGEGARARAATETGYSLPVPATGCEYFIDTTHSNASAFCASSAGFKSLSLDGAKKEVDQNLQYSSGTGMFASSILSWNDMHEAIKESKFRVKFCREAFYTSSPEGLETDFNSRFAPQIIS